jgi:hypothetical protein
MPRRARGEEGVTLLLALAFLSLFALVIPAILQLGGTNLLDTSRLHQQRSDVYAADGATEAAIQYVRDHPNCGRLGLACPTSSVSWTSGPTTASAAFAYGGGVLDFDRTFNITTTVGGGVTRLRATVIIRDSQQLGNAEPPVDVKSWTYVR